MRRRALPIALLALFLGLALGLLSIPLLVREGTPVVSTAAPLAFSADLGSGSVNGRLELMAGRRFEATFELSALAGEEPVEGPVSLVLVMPEHAMSPLVPALSQADGGGFIASGILPMPGLWELRFVISDGQAKIPFRVEG